MIVIVITTSGLRIGIFFGFKGTKVVYKLKHMGISDLTRKATITPHFSFVSEHALYCQCGPC